MWSESETSVAGAGAPAISSILSKNLTPDTATISPRLLAAIKSTIRSSDAEAVAAVPAILSSLRHPHSQVRYLTVLITDELFMRSKLFRTLLVEKLDEFLALSVGFRPKQVLPPPAAVAAALRAKSIEVLEKWNDGFGVYYRQVRLAVSYLKNVLRYKFPNRVEVETRRERERREKEERTRVILGEKFGRLRENFAGIRDEVKATVVEIEECLDILCSKNDNGDDGFVGNFVKEEDGVEEFTSLKMLRIREESLKEGGKVYENMENKAIFDALREAHKILVTKHMPSVREWITVLVRVDVDHGGDNLADRRFRDAALREFIDLRNAVQSVEKRCIELGCCLEEKLEEDEEDFWEEGTIEISKPGECSTSKSSVVGSLVDPTVNKGKSLVTSKPAAPPRVKRQSSGADSSSTSERSKLLAEAPVMNWGPFMDYWGSEQDVLANQRGMELDNHWGRVDYDATIPAEKIAELNVHRMVYKEEPVETQPCLAPLKKGGLCQRRDLKVCPFHGPIVPRDVEGNPIDQDPSAEETKKDTFIQKLEPSITEEAGEMNDFIDATSDSTEGMAERLAKQAVKNIRDRDMEMKSQKRAKLAQIREHNNTVLRDAALASTSYSEHVTAAHEYETNIQAKNMKSSSRQRKKVTPKDRISQRLLKTKVTESSIRQIRQGEHSKYREAFPNQW